MNIKDKQAQQEKRKLRIRGKMQGTAIKPRLTVFRSNKHLYAQLIDDNERKVIASVSDLKDKGSAKRQERAKELGKKLAQIAKDRKIEKAVFDRSGYAYHGNVKAIAEGAREGGLSF